MNTMYNNWSKDFPWTYPYFDGICNWAPGWIEPIYEMCKSISKVLDEHPESEISILEVKEKFGLFTFYFMATNDIYELIDELSEKCKFECKKHCQFCEKPATEVTDKWISYVCNEHKIKFDF